MCMCVGRKRLNKSNRMGVKVVDLERGRKNMRIVCHYEEDAKRK